MEEKEVEEEKEGGGGLNRPWGSWRCSLMRPRACLWSYASFL